jgi:hypothetical protein
MAKKGDKKRNDDIIELKISPPNQIFIELDKKPPPSQLRILKEKNVKEKEK